MTLDNHFFALFGLEVGFDIDKAQLKRQFLNLQKQHHPDTASDKIAAEKNASLINHAFNTLNRDDNRAMYLLTLAGQDINLNHSISDLDFLDAMMDIRIELDDTEESSALLALNQKVNELLEQHAQDFLSTYNQQNWSLAGVLAQKLQFLGKLQDDIVAKYNQSLSQHHNDDDLYV